MSDPKAETKKDDKKDGKSPGSKIWGGVGTFLVAMLGVIVFITLAQALFPMAFSGVNGLFGGIFSGITSIFSTVGSGISAIGSSFGNMSGNLRDFLMGLQGLPLPSFSLLWDSFF